RDFASSAGRYFSFVRRSSYWRRSSASSSRGVDSSCASSWSCIAGAFSFISGTSPESDAVGPDPVQGHVEYAVPIGDRGRVRLDRLGQLDLAVEDPSIGVSGVDREPMLRRGEFQRLAGRSEEHTSELQSRVDLVCRLLLEK